MSNAVPDGWSIENIGKLSTKVGSGVTPRGGSKAYSLSGVKFIRSQNVHFYGLNLVDVVYISEDIHSSMSGSKLREGDVLLNITGASIGRCTFVPENFGEANVNQHVCIIRPNDKVKTKYLSQWLSSDFGQNAISIYQAGGNREGLNFQQIRSMVVNLPPLPEQQKIAAILSSVDDVIEKTQAQIDKLKDLKTGMKQELLSPTEGSGQSKAMGHTEFKDSPVGRIPVGWDVCSASEVSDAVMVGVVIKPTQYYVESGVPALRSANVREQGLTFDNMKYFSEESNEILSKSKLQLGDLLTVRTGYPGTTAVVTNQFVGANCIDVVITRPSARMDSNYFGMWVNSDNGKGQVLKAQGGLAQQHFNVGDMKNLLVAVPPLDEQKAIFKAVESVNGKIKTVERKLSSITNTKKALMQDLLTGKVRVKVN